MATIKIACPRCGQKVSGDESFSGTTVECPVCSSQIKFPGDKARYAVAANPQPVPPSRDTGHVAEQPEPPAASPESLSAQDEKLNYSSKKQPTASSQPTNWEDVDQEIPSPLFGAISLVCGILGIVTCVFGPLFAPLAIIFGHIALARGKHSPVQPAPGRNLALIGVIIGYLNLLLVIIALVGIVFFKEPVGAFLDQIKTEMEG